jgi:hypothetical protein
MLGDCAGRNIGSWGFIYRVAHRLGSLLESRKLDVCIISMITGVQKGSPLTH